MNASSMPSATNQPQQKGQRQPSDLSHSAARSHDDDGCSGTFASRSSAEPAHVSDDESDGDGEWESWGEPEVAPSGCRSRLDEPLAPPSRTRKAC